MHFKNNIWTFFHQNNYEDIGEGLIALNCYDDLAYKLIKDAWMANKKLDNRPRVLLGAELTQTWLENNLQSLDLFGNKDSYIIHAAQEMKEELKQEFLNVEDLLLENRFILLNFTKSDTLFNRLQKKMAQNLKTFQVTAPAFWEEKKFLDFLCERMSVDLNFSAKEFIISQVQFSFDTYYHLLYQIKLNFPQSKGLDVKELAQLVHTLKVDQFQMVGDFGNKKMHAFYDSLLKAYEAQPGDFLTLVYFLQSHLLKMSDPSFLDQKKKLSQYDKQIKEHIKNWSKAELSRALNYVGKILTMTKRKDPFLKAFLRKDFLRSRSI